MGALLDTFINSWHEHAPAFLQANPKVEVDVGELKKMLQEQRNIIDGEVGNHIQEIETAAKWQDKIIDVLREDNETLKEENTELRKLITILQNELKIKEYVFVPDVQGEKNSDAQCASDNA